MSDTIPLTPDALAAWLHRTLGISIPSTPLLDGSDAPFAYLVHSFFEGRFILHRDGTHSRALETLPADCAVWANRGGGKTFLGAIATALDLIFKPGIEVRILGGSLEQSRRMYEHLRTLFEKDEIKHLLDGDPTEKRLRLKNKSRVEILAQSERSVRGTRVQKLRCDEADLFDRELWNAAQLTTRSLKCPGPWGSTVRGSVEVLSTMHIPMGLMWNVVQESRRLNVPPTGDSSAGRCGDAQEHRPLKAAVGGTQSPTRILFRWGVVDSLEHCGDEHQCEPCTLKDECAGRAKQRPRIHAGHLSVADAKSLKARVSKAAWESEMLCLRPRRTDAVFPEFDPDLHVLNDGVGRASPPAAGEVTFTRDAEQHALNGLPLLIAGMDFGIRAPTVILWALLDRSGLLRIVDEYVEPNRTLQQHVRAIDASPWGRPAWLGVDPAGSARNDQTGSSNIVALGHAELKTKHRRAGITESLELIRARLQPATGQPTLFIAPNCVKLIESLQRYHYPLNRPFAEAPEKDGPDHAVDALRYLLINLHAHDVKIGMS